MARPRLRRPTRSAVALALPLLLLGGCSDDDDDGGGGSVDDPLATLGPVVETRHDGEDGLLGGWSLAELQAASAPDFYADPTAPTSAELRRAAIYLNYKGLVDTSDAGGFGRLYGLDPAGGNFPGTEYQAYVGEGVNRARLMVQVPDAFDPDAPCIVVAPSSGSRGVYGAVGTGGEWGLGRGCAVAYTDAGKGTGAVELTAGIGYGMRLEALDLAATEEEPSFVVPTTATVPEPDAAYGGIAPPSPDAVATFAETYPNRYAFRHAHSQKNVERDWGRWTVASVEFAFRVLGERFERRFGRDDTLVLGASVSNGGAALIRAVESDPGLFDGVVVGEPNVNPAPLPEPVEIRTGEREPVADAGVPAYAYFLEAERYAVCATNDPANSGALFAGAAGSGEGRCAALVAAGLVADGTPAERGAAASARLVEAGYLEESLPILVGYAGIGLFQSLLATYGNAYSRSAVSDHLCDISMSDVADGALAPRPPAALATLAPASNGIPPTAGIALVKDDAPGGPAPLALALSSDGSFDNDFEGAQCWYSLYADPADPLNGRLRDGIGEILATGDLGGVPVAMVHGRSDALIPVNHSSRAYYALNAQVEGEGSALRYYEIENAQHLDAFNPLYANTGTTYVPIDYYFKQALDLMWAYLDEGGELPPSQLVRARAPDGALAASDLPPIAPEPADAIVLEDGTLLVPD